MPGEFHLLTACKKADGELSTIRPIDKISSTFSLHLVDVPKHKEAGSPHTVPTDESKSESESVFSPSLGETIPDVSPQQDQSLDAQAILDCTSSPGLSLPEQIIPEPPLDERIASFIQGVVTPASEKEPIADTSADAGMIDFLESPDDTDQNFCIPMSQASAPSTADSPIHMRSPLCIEDLYLAGVSRFPATTSIKSGILADVFIKREDYSRLFTIDHKFPNIRTIELSPDFALENLHMIRCPARWENNGKKYACHFDITIPDDALFYEVANQFFKKQRYGRRTLYWCDPKCNLITVAADWKNVSYLDCAKYCFHNCCQPETCVGAFSGMVYRKKQIFIPYFSDTSDP